MKKILNKSETLVLEMCNGLVQANPELKLDKKYKILTKKVPDQNKVNLLSGGGSGHEPAHGGYIGKGMLDGAICGDVFASPSQIQVYQAIKATQNKKGTLLIIKNYSGDMMNFKNAAHLASLEGIPVDFVRVNDDIAVEDSLYTVGRRGVAGTVLVHKIAGAAAEQGKDLGEVKRLAQKAADRVRSIGFALTSCTVPAKGSPTFHLEGNEMEYGVGIHGEPGSSREILSDANALAERMTDALLKDLQITASSDAVTVLINGFGATPLMELYLLNNAVQSVLAKKGIHCYRSFVGNYMTSIDMAGASVSLLKMDPELEALLDYPSDAPAFTVKGAVEKVEFVDILADSAETMEASFTVETSAAHSKIAQDRLSFDNMVYLLDVMSQTIIEKEQYFCELDSHAGDGDFGMSIAKGFRQLKRHWSEIVPASGSNIGALLKACARIFMEYCGGASGPLWGFAFFNAGQVAEEKSFLTVAEMAEVLQAAVKGIQDTGERSFGRGAVVGDKTLLDALIPCADTWTRSAAEGISIKAALVAGAKAAVEGAENTKTFAAHMGRAENAGEKSIGYPDAGAFALGAIFTILAESMTE